MNENTVVSYFSGREWQGYDKERPGLRACVHTHVRGGDRDPEPYAGRGISILVSLFLWNRKSQASSLLDACDWAAARRQHRRVEAASSNNTLPRRL